MEKQIKVFKMDECDWVAAASLDEATSYFRANAPGDIDDGFTPYELTDEQMDTLKHTGDDGSEYKTPITFREELAKDIKDGVQFPCIFASREI